MKKIIIIFPGGSQYKGCNKRLSIQNSEQIVNIANQLQQYKEKNILLAGSSDHIIDCSKIFLSLKICTVSSIGQSSFDFADNKNIKVPLKTIIDNTDYFETVYIVLDSWNAIKLFTPIEQWLEIPRYTIPRHIISSIDPIGAAALIIYCEDSDIFKKGATELICVKC